MPLKNIAVVQFAVRQHWFLHATHDETLDHAPMCVPGQLHECLGPHLPQIGKFSMQAKGNNLGVMMEGFVMAPVTGRCAP